MLRRLFILGALCLGVWVGTGHAQDSEESHELPFHLPTPEGWTTETIPFPLGFAPALEYEGLEELRFAPGMFKAGSEDLWSYAFVWWMTGDVAITVDSLTQDLVNYYQGLCAAVLGDSAATHDITTRVQVTAAKDGSFSGSIETFDAFVAKTRMTLNFTVHPMRCEAAHHTVALFSVSPQPSSHDIWNQLGEIRSGFNCSASD